MRIKAITLILSIIFIVAINGKAQIANSADSLILVEIYDETDGENWTITWNLETPVRGWHGVTLKNSGRVECLDFGTIHDCEANVQEQRQFLNGSFPDISGLDELKVLKVKDNVFGEFPEFLTSLIKLEYLYLNSCNIIGELPSSISNLSNLKELNLSVNRLSGELPDALGALTSLELLNLSFNEFEGAIPDSYFNLEELVHWRMRGMELTGEISNKIEKLSQLETLIFCGNSFQGEIPTSLTILEHLTDLDLEFNKLTGPIPFGLLSEKTNSVGLEYNGLEGCIPDDFFEFGCGIYVTLSSNPGLTNGGEINLCNQIDQTGFPCDDQFLSTSDDVINEDCTCRGTYAPFQTFCGANKDLEYSVSSTGECEVSKTGIVNFKLKEDNNYSVNINSSGIESEDITFGIYNTCFGVSTNNIYLNLEGEDLMFVGQGQAGEIFTIVDQIVDGNSLILEIESDFVNYTVDIVNEEGWSSLRCYIDEDGDGFYSDIDCNDIEANINPDAADLTTNGIDENCDGIDGSTAVEDIEEQISIYPNPSSHYISLSGIDFSKNIVKIYNPQGSRLIIDERVEYIDIAHLPAGIYILKVVDLNSKNVIFLDKFIKV